MVAEEAWVGLSYVFRLWNHPLLVLFGTDWYLFIGFLIAASVQ